MIDFRTHPDRYRHWKVAVDGAVATIAMDVAEAGGLVPGYTLKLNSYDLGVDIELYDAVQRLRFTHPEVGAVIVTSARDRVFCAGANIAMLGQSSHAQKVNFCKFTNETRNAIEDASRHSGQTYLSAINGTAAGGGYELALATEYIILVDDGSSAVSLPEVALLAVLPGTGGLTRVVDKRRVRRDLADVFCSLTEGVRGRRALEWRLVDEVVPRSRLDEIARQRAEEFAGRSDRPRDVRGIDWPELDRDLSDDRITYDHLSIALDRAPRSRCTGRRQRRRRTPRPSTPRGSGSGRWPWPARSTTRSYTCAAMSRSSAPGSSAPAATQPWWPPPTGRCWTTPTTGWCGRSRCT
jgi:benzoyl-CoA-dihydrodiol lyase